MPNKIAKFEKVSYEQFEKDYLEIAVKFNKNMTDEPSLSTDPEEIRRIYDSIVLPKRATVSSAGYDFFAPFDFKVPANRKSIIIPTGIRCHMEDDGWMLALFPRSGLGFKYRVALDNTVGIIDADYYNAENEGHIMIKLHSDTNLVVDIREKQGISQGILIPYGITIDDTTTEKRVGGIGSTDKKE